MNMHVDRNEVGGNAVFWEEGAINRLKPSGYCPNRFSMKQILRSAHTVYLCVLCGSQNKQRLFPYTALTDWFL
jgi:hypothetical protein